MFTGIVKDVGTLTEVTDLGGDRRLTVATNAPGYGALELGESIAVNGVCLTVVEAGPSRFSADVSGETLRCTTLGGLAAGARVNLERALAASDRLGGHLVAGHVDGVGTVVELAEEARSKRVAIEVPEALARYLASKGSIAVDGVSLTVNAVAGARFEVNIVPHTLDWTTFADYVVGSAVNIEVDVIARYVERLVEPWRPADGAPRPGE